MFANTYQTLYVRYVQLIICRLLLRTVGVTVAWNVYCLIVSLYQHAHFSQELVFVLSPSASFSSVPSLQQSVNFSEECRKMTEKVVSSFMKMKVYRNLVGQG